MKTTIKLLRQSVDRSGKTWMYWLTGMLCFHLFTRVMHWMEMKYAETQHPASVMGGQTTFNGGQIKQFYAVMSDAGTLDRYVQVQLFDFGLMLSMFAALFVLCLAVYKSLPERHWAKNIAWGGALVFPLAPVFDALENLVSFFMLANPSDFPDVLAIPYSTFAVTKFVLSGLGFGWVVIGAVVALFSWILWQVKQRSMS